MVVEAAEFGRPKNSRLVRLVDPRRVLAEALLNFLRLVY